MIRLPTRRQVGLLFANAAAMHAQSERTGTTIHQEIDFNVPPARIYGILLDAKQFSAFTKRHGGTRITGRRCFPAVRWEDRGAECGTGNESEDRTSMASRGVARWRLFNRPIRTKRAGFGHAHCFRSCRLSARQLGALERRLAP